MRLDYGRRNILSDLDTFSGVTVQVLTILQVGKYLSLARHGQHCSPL